MKKYTDNNLITRADKQSIQQELENTVLLSGQTPTQTAADVLDTNPYQVYQSIFTTAGAASQMLCSGTAGQALILRKSTTNQRLLIPSLANLNGFLVRFSFSTQRTGTYQIQLSSTLTGGEQLPTKELVNDDGVSLPIGSLPLNRLIEAYYSLSLDKWVLTTACSRTIFGNQYMVVQHRKDAGEFGGEFPWREWGTFTLNTIIGVNNTVIPISGSNEESPTLTNGVLTPDNQIILPAGEYRITGNFQLWALTEYTAAAICRLRTTEGTDLINSIVRHDDNSNDGGATVLNIPLAGRISLFETTTMVVEGYVNSRNNPGTSTYIQGVPIGSPGGFYPSLGISEVYSNLMIERQ